MSAAGSMRILAAFFARGFLLPRPGKLELSRAPDPAQAASSPTLVAFGARFVGDLFGSDDVVVEGRFEGKIRVERNVRIARTGEVDGDVDARSVLIEGRVRGQIRAAERAELTPSAVVQGTLEAPKIIIAEGAQLHGSVAMREEPAVSAKTEGTDGH